MTALVRAVTFSKTNRVFFVVVNSFSFSIIIIIIIFIIIIIIIINDLLYIIYLTLFSYQTYHVLLFYQVCFHLALL